MKPLVAALALLLAASGAVAGDLRGRIVTLGVLAYDDPARPIYQGRGRTVKVGDGVEFGLDPEGSQNGVDVHPVSVDIGPRRIEIAFDRTGAGYLLTAAFNGYLLQFEAECALFTGARVDEGATNVPLAPDALRIEGGTLHINVSGLYFTPDSRLAIDLDVTDCPLS